MIIMQVVVRKSNVTLNWVNNTFSWHENHVVPLDSNTSCSCFSFSYSTCTTKMCAVCVCVCVRTCVLVFCSKLGQLFNRVDLIKPVSNVRPSIRAYIRTCIRPSAQKSFFDFHEIWHVGRGRWVMQYDLIQGHGQSHKPFKVGNPAFFNSYLLSHLQWELATDYGFLN